MPITYHFPCPNCGADRSAERTPCLGCGWPLARQPRQQSPAKPAARRPFQFRLRTALMFLTIASVAFAIVGRIGVEGATTQLGESLLIAICFLPVIEYGFWMKKQLNDCDL